MFEIFNVSPKKVSFQKIMVNWKIEVTEVCKKLKSSARTELDFFGTDRAGLENT